MDPKQLAETLNTAISKMVATRFPRIVSGVTNFNQEILSSSLSSDAQCGAMIKHFQETCEFLTFTIKIQNATLDSDTRREVNKTLESAMSSYAQTRESPMTSLPFEIVRLDDNIPIGEIHEAAKHDALKIMVNVLEKTDPKMGDIYRLAEKVDNLTESDDEEVNQRIRGLKSKIEIVLFFEKPATDLSETPVTSLGSIPEKSSSHFSVSSSTHEDEFLAEADESEADELSAEAVTASLKELQKEYFNILDKKIQKLGSKIDDRVREVGKNDADFGAVHLLEVALRKLKIDKTNPNNPTLETQYQLLKEKFLIYEQIKKFSENKPSSKNVYQTFADNFSQRPTVLLERVQLAEKDNQLREAAAKKSFFSKTPRPPESPLEKALGSLKSELTSATKESASPKSLKR